MDWSIFELTLPGDFYNSVWIGVLIALEYISGVQKQRGDIASSCHWRLSVMMEKWRVGMIICATECRCGVITQPIGMRTNCAAQ